jgi:hypothetical protein
LRTYFRPFAYAFNGSRRWRCHARTSVPVRAAALALQRCSVAVPRFPERKTDADFCRSSNGAWRGLGRFVRRALFAATSQTRRVRAHRSRADCRCRRRRVLMRRLPLDCRPRPISRRPAPDRRSPCTLDDRALMLAGSETAEGVVCRDVGSVAWQPERDISLTGFVPHPFGRPSGTLRPSRRSPAGKSSALKSPARQTPRARTRSEAAVPCRNGSMLGRARPVCSSARCSSVAPVSS